jgi:serine/threonine protein kinase/tetratricopeptide (TPR) repeat protein
MIGRTLAHYTILEKIGEGGMGEVYRARDARLGRDVALKLLPQTLDATPDRLGRFEREARTVAGLNHPNIVTVFSFEEAEGRRFLTMELVEGRSLDRLLAPKGLPLARVLEVALPLADALVAAHEKGVVHRDLKPGNVMVTADGRVKVLDFGLAKLARPDGDPELSQAATMESPISKAGQLLGTVPYMAPEQVRGEAVDARSDLFALGIILYELAAGSRPFTGHSNADISSAILRDAPLPLSRVRPDLSGDLGRVVGRCLEKDPDRRFQTAKDVRTELEILSRDSRSPVPASAASSAVPAPAEAPSIAVLPFANRSRDEEDEYFSDGLADELLSVLAKVRGLRVAARTSSGTFKGKEVTIAEVGKALNVATVLEGSVRKAGNRVRIAVQLVKVSDGYPLWSETYDRTLDDIFAVQDDIAQSVVKELRTALLGETADSDASREARADVAIAAKGRGRNPEAHRLYLQGKHLVDRLNPEDSGKGVALLEQALALDPGHAPAWVSLGEAFINAGAYGWGAVAETSRKAKEAVERALALDPDLAEAYVRLCRIQRIHGWDWNAAQAASRRALELAPESTEALREAAVLAGQLGRFQESLELLERALIMDPLSSTGYTQLGYVLRSLGRPGEAIEAYRKALDLTPQRISAHHMISVMHADAGRDAEAQEESSLEPAEWARLTSLAYLHYRAGRNAEGDAVLERLEREFAEDTALQIAALHATRGDADRAFEWLERAYDQRDAGLSQMQQEPTLRPLHGDPRWAALRSKVRFDKV